MSLYAVILTRPSEDAWAAVRREWEGKHHIVDDRLAVLKDDNALTSDIASELGMNAEGDSRGIVTQMDYFAGRTTTSLVEWINKNRD